VQYFCTYLTSRRAGRDARGQWKLRLSLSLIVGTTPWRRVGEWRYRSAHSCNVDIRWRWVVSFTPRPLHPRYPLDRRLGPRTCLHALTRKNPSRYRESYPGRPACSLVTILTELQRRQFCNENYSVHALITDTVSKRQLVTPIRSCVKNWYVAYEKSTFLCSPEGLSPYSQMQATMPHPESVEYNPHPHDRFM
jgi:hypothetical protein